MDIGEFIHAIASAPDDDEARLALADWLTRCGDPRGEFIRVQVALAQGTGDTATLRAREQELLATHRDEWLAPLAQLGSDW